MAMSLESSKDALSPKKYSHASSTNVPAHTEAGTMKRPKHRSVFSSRSQHQSREFLDQIPTYLQKELRRIKISNEEEADRQRGYRISTARRRAPKDTFNRSYDPSKPYTARSLEQSLESVPIVINEKDLLSKALKHTLYDLKQVRGKNTGLFKDLFLNRERERSKLLIHKKRLEQEGINIEDVDFKLGQRQLTEDELITISNSVEIHKKSARQEITADREDL